MPSLHRSLSDSLKRPAVQGTDQIQIGSEKVADMKLRRSSMADVAKLIQGVRYLVRDWIPFGMVTGVIAEPGVGKSAFVLYSLVRAVVTGCDWFNRSSGPKQPGDAIWCPTESDMGITIERLRGWSIPMERILTIFPEDPLMSMVLSDKLHLARLEDAINQFKTKLVVVDSLRGSHGGDENSSQMEQPVKSLAKIAERTNAAIVVVHHSKKLVFDQEITSNSSRGSNAIIALFRSMIGIDKPDPGSAWCRMRVLKENLGIAPPPVGFLISKSGIEFGVAPKKPVKVTKKQEAVDWLTDYMKADKLYHVAETEKLAGLDGFSPQTLKKAATVLGVQHIQIRKDGKLTGWGWKLPK